MVTEESLLHPPVVIRNQPCGGGKMEAEELWEGVEGGGQWLKKKLDSPVAVLLCFCFLFILAPNVLVLFNCVPK